MTKEQAVRILKKEIRNAQEMGDDNKVERLTERITQWSRM
jgi:hypothetical protein